MTTAQDGIDWRLPPIDVLLRSQIDQLRFENRGLAQALQALADVVETALDAGLFLSVDGKRPEIMALAEARRVLAGEA